ncbi:MAG: hypothetical protein JWL88_546 [Parcubacteria group bacterium]|nr:hypothetical protein [Parcubacteria group bacterium]
MQYPHVLILLGAALFALMSGEAFWFHRLIATVLFFVSIMLMLWWLPPIVATLDHEQTGIAYLAALAFLVLVAYFPYEANEPRKIGSWQTANGESSVGRFSFNK